jgi:hypothetical protein
MGEPMETQTEVGHQVTATNGTVWRDWRRWLNQCSDSVTAGKAATKSKAKPLGDSSSCQGSVLK